MAFNLGKSGEKLQKLGNVLEKHEVKRSEKLKAKNMWIIDVKKYVKINKVRKSLGKQIRKLDTKVWEKRGGNSEKIRG